ncbi:MAG: D-2-hydroxyacid dehydrogenase family protein [Rhodospirillales bacterium]|nr:D-2-hydroxyacid dehydrogenase family protein [Rhodospirillales bacterium]
MTRIAILDDWQGIAEAAIDWSALRAKAELVFFRAPFPGPDSLAATLGGFDGLLVMRERTQFPGTLLARLPRLRIISSPGPRNAAIDIPACTAQGVLVCNTPATRSSNATAELALGLLLACARRLAQGDSEIRAGRFQERVAPGMDLAGRTLGIIGLGRIGATMARYGLALGMKVQAWSQNLTEERAAEVGVARVDKETLLATSDAISIHMVLSPRSRGIVSGADIARMKPGGILINTSRAPLVEMPALVAALYDGRVMAGLDVFDTEPLPADDPVRGAPNCVLSPQLGYVTADNMADFYRFCAENLLAWANGAPIRVMNPEAVRPA